MLKVVEIVGVKTMGSETARGSDEPLINKVYSLIGEGLISFEIGSFRNFMPYEGSVEEIAGKLKTALDYPSPQSYLDLFLFTNRLLNGIIDYALLHDVNLLDLKHKAELFGVEVFKGHYRRASEILASMELNELLEGKVQEVGDKISWAAFEPSTVENLMVKMDEDEVDFDCVVLDGHDAYRPGFMIAAYYDVGVCAIRNAQDSGRDNGPRLMKGEKEHLKKALTNQRVLVLGEDVSTGRAVISLVELVGSVSSPRKIITAAPIAIRGHPEGTPQYFGEERYTF